MIRATMHKVVVMLTCLATLVACDQGAPTAPTRAVSPGSRLSNLVSSKAATLTVCASGPAGTYSYAISNVAGGANVQSGAVTLVEPFGTTFTLSADDCKDVVQLVTDQYITLDPITFVTVTQTSGPAGAVLDHTLITELEQQPPCLSASGDPTFPCGVDVEKSGATQAIGINLFHGSVGTWVNTEQPSGGSNGCTLTFGYWKTHPSSWPAGYSPNALFFKSGQTWLSILNAPPKDGNAYLILAHQWIAVTLNVASGASMPSAVQSAYDAGTAYLSTGVGSNPIGWASVLDQYNNGLAAGGPAHCN